MGYLDKKRDTGNIAQAGKGASIDPFFAWLEDSALSVYVRQSESVAFGFPGILTLHTLGMGFLVAASVVIDLRVLSVTPRAPLMPMKGFLPVFWIALAVNIASGILLLIGYPTKALTNPLFYMKLTGVFVAVWLLKKLADMLFSEPVEGHEPLSRRAKRLAALSLVCWTFVIFAGRFLAYTHTRLLVDTPARF